MQPHTSWTVRRRLLSGFATVAALAASLGAIGYWAAATGRSSVEEIGSVRLPSVHALLVITEAQNDIDSGENALLARGLSSQGRQEQHDRFAAAKKRVDAAWKAYEPLPQTPDEAGVWKTFVPAWERWWKDHETYEKIARQYEQAPTDENYAALSEFALVTIGRSYSESQQLLDKLVEINNRVADETSSQARQRATWIQSVAAIVSIAAVLGALGIGFFLSGRLNRHLGDIARQLSEGAHQVAAASSQVSASAQSLSQGSTEQAASIEETSASMEEMAAMTRQNADNAREAASLMHAVDGHVATSNQALTDMVGSMGRIQNSSAKISRIIRTIDEIAFQTNILALNAAVEAARAGDAGMGFAVVADEVRSLAQRSADAAKETAELIEESGANATEGTERVNHVASTMSAIIAGVGKVKLLVEQVSSASQQQAQGIEQVTQAVSQMEKVTQTAAANAEESAAASEELNAQAETTLATVGDLERMVGIQRTVSAGASHAATSHPHLRVAHRAGRSPDDVIPLPTSTFGH